MKIEIDFEQEIKSKIAREIAGRQQTKQGINDATDAIYEILKEQLLIQRVSQQSELLKTTRERNAFNDGYSLGCKTTRKKMEKYYFETTGWDNGTCAEKCKVKDNGVMIGSAKCQQCEFCVEHQKPCEFTGDVDWIKCSKLDEARK